MSRPYKCRRVLSNPEAIYFKPEGNVNEELEEVILTLDEFEAICLADCEGLYQEQAAERMNVSRQTFGNIINSAHKKVADFLINAKVLRIQGGVIEAKGKEVCHVICYDCKHTFDVSFGTAKPVYCPNCKSPNIHRSTGKNK